MEEELGILVVGSQDRGIGYSSWNWVYILVGWREGQSQEAQKASNLKSGPEIYVHRCCWSPVVKCKRKRGCWETLNHIGDSTIPSRHKPYIRKPSSQRLFGSPQKSSSNQAKFTIEILIDQVCIFKQPYWGSKKATTTGDPLGEGGAR